MAEFQAPANKEEYDQNFAPIKPSMTDTQAHYESARCLFCYDAPCIQACPSDIDIPLFIRQINSGFPEGAARTIYDQNWFGHACGKVCPTEVLCEGSCVYTNQGQPAVDIGRLQAYATSSVLESGKKLYEPGKDNGKKVAIIGSGPAGLGAACELRLLGFAVKVFEAKSQPSGLTVHGIAPYKITNSEVLDEMSWLQQQLGYEVEYDHKVSPEELAQLVEDYDAVFIGVGLGKTRSTGIPGEELEGVVGAVEFVEALRAGESAVSVPSRVVVLGGGNTAMDVASESARMGAQEVHLVYRRSKESMGAYEFEYDLAKEAGVRGIFEANPKAILGEGKVSAVEFVRTRNEDGRLVEIEGSNFSIDADLVIRATGQEKQRELYSAVAGLETDEKGRIRVNHEGQTGNPKVFAGGDAVNGGAEVVNAVAEGRDAAQAIQSFCFPK